MKLSKKFLQDYVDVDVDSFSLGEAMTKVGNEYDSIYKMIPCTNLVIGEVLECINHPDSDHLHVCQVNIGSKMLQIVCGAPNVKKGIKVIVALDGAELPGGIIKKSIIRGQESNGMLCALYEIGIENKYLSEEDKNGIHVLPENAPVGEDPAKFMKLDDEVIDFELTANRGDLLSVLGMAYEVGAIYNKKVKDIDLSYNSKKERDDFTLEIKTSNCKLFLAKKVLNVKIGESPLFIKNRLMASGIRPINNIVDISNYVMLETGQPLHFYDADLLGNNITVRMATENEELKTLDGNLRKLSKDDIVITDSKKVVGLAGVMGGFDTEINDNTKNILIESAIFDPVKIRMTSKKILRSEASSRFEKGLDPNRSYMAIERSCNLLEKYANGTVLENTTEYNELSLENKIINIKLSDITKLLGLEITEKEVIDIFFRFGFKTTIKNSIMEVSVPTRRIDISIKEDLIEEVGRLYGVDNIQGKLPISGIKIGKSNKTFRELRNKMVDFGFNETLSYTLINENDMDKFTNEKIDYLTVKDPMTEERVALRHSLLPSLISTLNYNRARNMKDIFLFEIGHSFFKKDNEYQEDTKLSAIMTGNYSLGLNNTKEVDFFILKGIIEELLCFFGFENRYFFEVIDLPKEMHPKVSSNISIQGINIGFFGKLHPNVTKENIYVMEINLTKLFNFKTSRMKYKEINKFPNILKDVAFIVDKDIDSETLTKSIKKAGGRLLTNISLFDVYVGDKIAANKKSMAFNLTFEDYTRTLSTEEVTIIFEKIINDVCKKHNAILRDK